MSFLPLMVAIVAGIVCLGSILQGIVAGIELSKGLSRKKWSVIMLICIVFATFSGYGSYKSYEASTSSSPTPSPTATSAPLPPFPNPTSSTVPAGTVLYNANWSKGSDGWNAVNEWSTTGGMLENNGSTTSSGTILAPQFQPTTANYVVDARIQLLKSTDLNGKYGFGLIVRSSGAGDGYACYIIGPDYAYAFIAEVDRTYGPLTLNYGNQTPLGTYQYSTDTNWHTYRVEVRGTQITFLIDNHQLVQATNGDYPSGTVVGLIDNHSVINVNYFRVTAL